MPPKKHPGPYVLVRWLEEESVGVVPSCNCEDKSEIFPGSTTRVKYGRKYFDAQILKEDENRQLLNGLCTKLINFEVSIDDLIREATDNAEAKVDSTTTCTSASLPPAKKTVAKKAGSTSSSQYQPPSKKAKKEAQISSAKARAAEIFSDDLQTQLREQREMITKLQMQLQEKTFPKTQIVSNSQCNFKSFQKNVVNVEQHDSSRPPEGSSSPASYDPFEDTTDYTPISIDSSPSHSIRSDVSTARKSPSFNSQVGQTSSSSAFVGQTPPASASSMSQVVPKRLQVCSPRTDAKTGMENMKANKPSSVELVPGYGVTLSQRQLDEAIDCSGENPTKLMRNLMSAFFTRAELAQSSCFGTGPSGNKALDQDIVAACIRFVQSRFKVSRSSLVDAINDKCSNCRRKAKEKKN